MPAVEHFDAIRRLAPKSLIDVGANKGQFSVAARHLFPDIEVHAFEPMEGARNVYKSVVHNPVTLHASALGSAPDEAAFFVASRSDSSSLLRPGELNERAYGISIARQMTVSVARLPDIIDLSTLPRPILLKIDVQGAELDVLKGAEALLHLVDAIYCEVAFARLYEGQPLADDIVQYLARNAFTLRGVFNQSSTKELGPTQADFLFVRRVAN